MCVIYVVEQNVKVSSSCVYHRLYFTHKLKNPIIKPHRKISKEPAANYSSGFWRHSSPTLLEMWKYGGLIKWTKFLLHNTAFCMTTKMFWQMLQKEA